MMTFYESPVSGNCYKIVLLLHQLQQPCERVRLDIDRGDTRRADFLALNPNGKVPLLRLADGRCLAESPAILWFLAEGSPFLEDDRWARALTLQWLSFEQYEIEGNIAVLRNRARLKGACGGEWQGEEAVKFSKGYTALQTLDRHFQRHAFATGVRYGVADIALYGYSHLASDAGYDLTVFPALCEWFERVREQPRYLSMRMAMSPAA